jgi:hypothetical protein
MSVTNRFAGGDATPEYVGVVLWNGTGWDAAQGNQQGTLLVSAARTASTSSAVQTNVSARGVLLFLNITAASGTGGLNLIVQGIDPVSGLVAQINNQALSASKVTTGLAIVSMYPGDVTAGGATLAQSGGVLPRMWQATVLHADGSSYTYSLGYATVV